MRSVAELATQLREFWLRDFGAAATTYSSADAGSISLTNTLFIATGGGYVGINALPEAPYALDVVGSVRIAGNLLDRSGNSWSIGSEDNPWGAVYAADLHVGNLVAENKIATTSGRIIVSSSTKLTAAVAAADATIDVAANTLASGDRIYFETTGKLEWMAVTSGPTTISGGYRYSVTRNLNGAGAQTWKAGDAVVNTGTTGQGFIDLYSRYGIPASGETSTTRVGPTIVGNVRTSPTYNDISERWAIGNLNGLYGYSATTYGFAAGNYASSWLSADATNGLRMMYASAVRMRLSTAGNLFINDSDGNAVFTFDSALGAEFTLPLTLGTNGGIYQGTGTFATPTTGLKIFNSGGVGKIAGYNTGTVQWYADTDGKLYAGAGNVWLDSNGLAMLNSISSAPTTNAVRWVDSGGATLFKESTYLSAGIGHFHLAQMYPPAANDAYWSQVVDRAAGQSTYMLLRAVGNTSTSQIILRGFDASQATTGLYGLVSFETAVAHYLKGSLGFQGATSGTATIVAPAVAGTPTLTLPTSTGTLALTSDVTTAVSGTSGKLTKFTGTNTVGNSIVTESGATLSAAGTFTIVGQSDTNQLVVKGYSTQTSPQILIQTSAAAELARIYVSASNAIAIGYQAGASLSSSTGSVLIGYQAGNALASNPSGPFIGYQAGKLSTAIDNLAIGNGALATQTTGAGNTAIGHDALALLNSGGSANLAIGDHSSAALTTGAYNVSIGSSALASCQTGLNNMAIGAAALNQCTGSGNVVIGAWAAYYMTTGADNMIFGTNGGQRCNGSRNVGIGTESAFPTGTTAFNDSIYIGYRSGYGGSAAGSNNVAIGSETLQKNVSNAVAIGFNAGKVQTGAGFTAVGYQAGLLSTSGTNSTLIGSGAGASLTTNGGCVMIGYQAGGSETAANKLYIHNSNSATPLIYGDFSTPSLTFNGTVTIADGYNMVFGGSTGTKLGSAASEKIGVWGLTPVVQPTTGVAAASFTANSGTTINDASTFDGYTIRQVVRALRNIGWLA